MKKTIDKEKPENALNAETLSVNQQSLVSLNQRLV